MGMHKKHTAGKARCGISCVSELPAEIPIFPLEGVLLLPRGHLPLNVFEDRYLAMVDDALKGDRLIGIIQPQSLTQDGDDATALYSTGCAGKIKSFSETDDGRYLITLRGVARFKVREECAPKDGYRKVAVDWSDYKGDLEAKSSLDIQRGRLKELLSDYFDQQDISCDWGMIDDADDSSLITCLSMVCPLGPSEKQALLEAPDCHARADMFMTMLEIAVREDAAQCGCHH